jgi:hypothetical protein
METPSWFELAQRLAPSLERGEFEDCIQQTALVLDSLPQSEFHSVVMLDFTNDVADIAQVVDLFFVEQQARFPVQRVAIGMNGFYINPKRWYGELVAWDSQAHVAVSPDTITLTGMESLQQVYMRTLGNTHAHAESKTTRDYCDLMVVFKYIRLMYRSLPLMQHVRTHVSIGVHDYDTLVYVGHPTP